MNFQVADLYMIAPHLVIGCAALLVLMAEAFLRKGKGAAATFISLAGIAAAAVATLAYNTTTNRLAFKGMLVNDKFSVFCYMIFFVVGALSILISSSYLKEEENEHGEYHALMLMAMLGMMFMASSAHLMMFFLGLETMSIAIYALAGFMRTRENMESSFKYFLLGGFASAFMLYGIALIYGSVGSTHIRAIVVHLNNTPGLASSPMFLAGIALLLVGFCFKVAAFPFHGWTPDVYQGAPTPITAFMATGVKAAAFAAFFRFFSLGFGNAHEFWGMALWVIAVLTMTMGNFAAINQKDVKRMLAYSSIAHAGYLLIGVIAATPEAGSGILFYLLAYALMNIGAFACVIMLSRKGDEGTTLDDFAGVGFKYPMIAAALSVFMFSMAGIPPTAGFIGKFMVFKAAVNREFYWLAILGVLNSAASVYYYLRVIVCMYFKERPEGAHEGVRTSAATSAATIAAAALVLILGVAPGMVVKLAQAALAGF